MTVDVLKQAGVSVSGSILREKVDDVTRAGFPAGVTVTSTVPT